MKLDKLRGWGSWLAFASPSCVVLAIALGILTGVAVDDRKPVPGWADAMGVLVFLLLGLFMLTMLAVALDLEWIEHPRTHTGWTYVALALAALATLGFVGFLVVTLFPFSLTLGAIFVIFFFAWMVGFGGYLVIINLVGRQARVLTGPLALVGLIAGVCWALPPLLTLFARLINVPLIAAFSGIFFPIGLLLYFAWSIWLGFRLRGKAPEPSPAAA